MGRKDVRKSWKVQNDDLGEVGVDLLGDGTVTIDDGEVFIVIVTDRVDELAAVLFEIARATAGVETIDGRTVIDVELPPLAPGRAPAPEVNPEWRNR